MTAKPREAVDRLETRCLVTSKEIADLLANGSLSTVSNWRSRYADFPRAVTGGRNPLFDAADVMSWWAGFAAAAGRRRIVPDPLWWWGKTIEAVHNVCSDVRVRPYVAALVLMRAVLHSEISGVRERSARWTALLDDADPINSLCLLAAELEGKHRQVRDLLEGPMEARVLPSDLLRDVLVRLDAASGEPRSAGRVLDEALARIPADPTPREPMTTTGDELASLMAGLVDDGGARTVYDPAAGEGTLLVACARHLRAKGAEIVAAGQELDLDSWRIARTRLLLDGVDADLKEPGLSSIDGDQWPDLRADVVVVDPPVLAPAPPLRDWVSHAVNHLAT